MTRMTIKKKFLFFLISFPTLIFSQSVSDIVDFSIDNPLGTARFESMGGAFGALGGDLSAININPAGSAVFNTNQYVLSFSNNEKKINTNFFNSSSSKTSSKFSVNNGGGVWVFENFGGGNIDKISFGINAQTNNSFHNDFHIKGLNNLNSIDKFFLNNATGFSASDLSVNQNETVSSTYRNLGEYFGFSAQQAFLAYQGYLLNYDDVNNEFYSIAKYDNGVYQDHVNETKGYNSKYNLNLAIQFKEDYFFGLNINTHEIFLENFIRHKETDFDSDSAVKSILYENRLTTSGEGFSFQLGALRKFNNFRIGIAYQSPTWYKLWDETMQYFETETVDINGTNYIDIVDPRISNLYPMYKIKTPSSITLSSAVIIGKIGLLSVDIVSKDYSKIKAKPKEDFVNTNMLIGSSLKSTMDIRLGTEIRLNKFSVRGGFNSNQSPYKNQDSIKDSSSYSYGFGYDFGSTIINFSHKFSEKDRNYQLFDSGLVDKANLTTDQSIYALSIVFNF